MTRSRRVQSWGKHPRKRRASISTGNPLQKTKTPNLTKYFRDLYSIPEHQEELDTTLGGAVEKHENGLCWWNVDLTEETGKKLKNGKGSPDQITADVLKALPPECLEKLART